VITSIILKFTGTLEQKDAERENKNKNARVERENVIIVF